jgi:hypothetical protein
MSGAAEPLLAAAAYRDENAERSLVELFGREGRLAGLSFKAFWEQFDRVMRSDAAYGAALKIFVARYEFFLKEGA